LTDYSVPASSVSASIFSSLSAARPSKESDSSASLASIIASASASRASSSAATGEETPKKITKEEAKEIIKNDLANWSTKFSSTSIKTLADLKSQIDDISEKAYERKHGFVEKEIASLQKLVDGGFEDLKTEITSLVNRLRPESSAEDLSAAQEKLHAATRSLGTQIRDKAQLLRTEAGEFLAKVYDDVSEAADQHLEILDGINDAGMQKLGMKWAWMDFVSYKDWAKYHELKNELKESRTTIIKSAEANEKLQEITNWVKEDWEGKATDIAKHAAEELKRLKKIWKQKIEHANASGNLAEYHVPVDARKAGQQVLKSAGKIKDVADTEDTPEKILESVDDAKSTISEAVVDKSTPVTESAASAVSEASKSVTSQVSEKAATAVPEALDSASSVVSESTARAKNKIPGGVEAGFVAAAEPIVYEEDALVDDLKSRFAEASMLSIATDKYSAAVAAASSIIYGTPTPTHEVLLSQAKEAYAQATAAAFDALRSAKRLAVTKVQPEEQPAKESLYSVASENYSSALSAAASSYSSVVSAGGEVRKNYESAVADARSILDEAASKASTMVYGTPQPAAESVLSVAHERYEQAVAEAQKTYDSWFNAASTQLYGTHTPAIESVFSSASASAASAASVVSKAGEDAASAASTMVYGTPAPSGISASASSLASEVAASLSSASDSTFDLAALRYAEMAALLGELVQNKPPTFSESVMARFSSAYYGTPTPVLSQASAFAASATAAVASMPPAIDEMIQDAVSRVKVAAAQASEVVYGKEPTALERYRMQLRKLGEESLENVSVAVYGTPKSGLEQAQETAASVVSQATEAAANAASQITEAASSAASQVAGVASQAYKGGSEAAHNAAVKLGWLEEEKAYKDALIDNARKRILAAVAAAEDTLRTVGKTAEEVVERVRDEL
jgi:hypothetical protein